MERTLTYVKRIIGFRPIGVNNERFEGIVEYCKKNPDGSLTPVSYRELLKPEKGRQVVSVDFRPTAPKKVEIGYENSYSEVPVLTSESLRIVDGTFGKETPKIYASKGR